MKRTMVILVVGLTPSLVGEFTPNIKKLAARGGQRPLNTILPAVTCSVQATLMTGTMPSAHGAVANGWFYRETSEVALWKQANPLISGEMIWDEGRKRNKDFTCAKMFWWYNMYSSANWSATPRPMYPADGRKVPDHYTQPSTLRDELNERLGTFPLFKFWGPMADISSSKWIAEATTHVSSKYQPTLSLCYLPHLDYDLQRHGPDLTHPSVQQSLRDIDGLVGSMIEAAEAEGQSVVIVSEYGITPVSDAIHINRALREAGMIAWRNELGREVIDPGASRAFAVVDHQLAHIYVRQPEDLPAVKALVAGLDGVERVLDEDGKRAAGLDHTRSGELVAISAPDRWFSYYYWLDDALAPDYAATVDIHRKPGYDPVELFVDPALKLPKLQAAWKVGRRKLGFRNLLDIISVRDTQLVKGSHGRITDKPEDGPLVISSRPELMPDQAVAATDFKKLVLDHVFA